MALGTIQKIFQRDGRKKPGAVIFTDGKKLTTFNDALIATAMSGVGQLAEYTIEVTESNGKQYENLGSITLKGAAQGAPTASQQTEAPRSSGVDFGSASLTSAVKDLTAAVRELTSQIGRAGSARVVSSAAGSPSQGAQASEAPSPAVDPISGAQEKLGRALNSPEAADAMFTALRAKHTDPAKLRAAAEALLLVHGVTA